MYRIQAHNLRTSRIEVFKIMSWEYSDLVSKLRSNPDYGLIEAEYLSRY